MRGRWIFQIDFGRIRAMGSGGRREAFEQFVCELAAEERPHPDVVFTCLRGAGGDGGVECFWALPDGGEHGWRAKFWVDSRNVDKAQFCDAHVGAHGDLGRRRPTLYPAQVGIGRGGQFTQWGAGLWAPRADRGGQL
jgi:hypothetical protein